jgi:uncharacterized protein YoxC
MDFTVVAATTSTASLVLRYSAAFFFVLVAVFLAYALFKAAKTLERLDKVLADVDENGIPLMQKAGETLDGVNANLDNVDEITKDVAGITDKIDTMANAVEGAVTTPARKAAAFSAGVQSAVSSFMKRDKTTATDGSTGPFAEPDSEPVSGWTYVAPEPAAEQAAAAAEDAAAAVADTASAGAAEAEAVAGEAATAAADTAQTVVLDETGQGAAAAPRPGES